MKRFYLLLPLFLLTLLLMAWSGVRDSMLPESSVMVGSAPLPTVTPTATQTLRIRSGQAPGWWDEVRFATPTLPKLPRLPKPQFQGGLDGPEPGQKVSFTVLSCPTEGVQITGIRTAERPWWHIYGTAAIPYLWYWKAEVSADGQHWAMLYRAETPVSNGLLVRLNLTTVPAGALQLRLTAVDRTGNYPRPCVVGVRR